MYMHNQGAWIRYIRSQPVFKISLITAHLNSIIVEYFLVVGYDS